MGNAFTFELESLIFWALTLSTMECAGIHGELAVYGDDIIVPSEIAPLVIDTLEGCGFEINRKKSFISGRFFESCGAHYFDDHLVTPAYMRRSTDPREKDRKYDARAELLRFHNRLRRWELRISGNTEYPLTSACCRFLRKYYERNFSDGRAIPAVPDGTLGDDGFLRPVSYFPIDINHGFYCHVLQWEQRRVPAKDLPLFAYKLRNPYTTYAHKRDGVLKDLQGEGRYKLRRRYIAASDITGDTPNKWLPFVRTDSSVSTRDRDSSLRFNAE